MSKIGITELVTEIGDDNIEFQLLDSCITNMQLKKDHNLYTFGSPMAFSLDGTNKLGLVLWLDREQVNKILGK